MKIKSKIRISSRRLPPQKAKSACEMHRMTPSSASGVVRHRSILCETRNQFSLTGAASKPAATQRPNSYQTLKIPEGPFFHFAEPLLC